MKRSWLAFSIAAGCLCALLTAHPICLAQKPVGPQISFKEKHFDFKQVDEGAILEHTFEILNTGDEPLVIEKVEPS
jgi:hypothetical protein